MAFPVFEPFRYSPGTPERIAEEENLRNARVEHVAKALWEAVKMMDEPFCQHWSQVPEWWKDEYRVGARTALNEYLRGFLGGV